MRLIIPILVIALLALASGTTFNVTGVINATTIKVQDAGVVRLEGVQASEAADPFIRKLLLNQSVTLDCGDEMQCDVYLVNKPVIYHTSWVNQILVESGMAWFHFTPEEEVWHSALEGGCDCSCSFVGNTRTFVFHKYGCPWAAKIVPANHFCFSSQVEAISSGYRPCMHCRPTG